MTTKNNSRSGSSLWFDGASLLLKNSAKVLSGKQWWRKHKAIVAKIKRKILCVTLDETMQRTCLHEGKTRLLKPREMPATQESWMFSLGEMIGLIFGQARLLTNSTIIFAIYKIYCTLNWPRTVINIELEWCQSPHHCQLMPCCCVYCL